MGRPEPCVLFAQSFFHSQLDEYIDEVIFAEPIVITACEFLEQNSSSAPNIPVTGATSPPSFALEIFVHCEGESRFRRLCQPFLYSHSSSNALEVEAIVTNHLVVRGSYRNLTLVVYGNTAEDLGQFNIEADLDNSLANVVSTPSEGKFEDLPPALWSNKLTFDEHVYSLKYIKFPFPEVDSPLEIRPFLSLALKICQVIDDEAAVFKVINTVISAVSSCAMNNGDWINLYCGQDLLQSLRGSRRDIQYIINVLDEASTELLELCKGHIMLTDKLLTADDTILDAEANVPSWEMLVEMFNKCQFFMETSAVKLPLPSKNKRTVLGLGLALLICCSTEGCFHFVTSGGMEQIVGEFYHHVQNSVAITLLFLTFVERATQHAIGCEGFLGWSLHADHDILNGNSDGYCFLLNLLLEKPRHDVASLVTLLLQRLRLYEVASRYEASILSLLKNLPLDCGITADGIGLLWTASSQLKVVLKLLAQIGPIEDPSPVTFARKLAFQGQSDGILSYKSTFNCIAVSKYSFTQGDTDVCLLSLLKEKGFFILSSALLSSPILCPTNGSTPDIFVDIATSIESILLYLLFHRSGLSFLLAQPEATENMLHALHSSEAVPKIECMTSRQAAVFLSKGFICRPHEIALIVELHLKVGIAIDRLLAAAPQSDELLWVLWELCAISRSDAGRTALLSISLFPEAMSVLLDALHSYKDLEAVTTNSGSSSLGLAIFYSASEILEVVVTDPTASSLRSWIEHAVKLHKALHSSSPGSNRKDAPTRLLEWIDAGVVYHRNGAAGLLRYAAVLASGGDAHLSSASVLVSDSVDVENVVADATNNSDTRVLDILLGKFVLDKFFGGVTLPNTSIVQLTTAFRILAFISEDPAVAASLFEEGAMTLIYVVLVNCKLMLERLSNSYDYLVDEGADYNSTTDLLLERSHEQNLIDLLIPSLLLLINILKRLQEAKEQYKNKKLLNSLLRLHREVSLKLAACAAGLCFPYPSSALGFGAVCHLLTSVLARWPVFGWTPGLFHCVLESVQATSVQALGPKDACSIFCLLGDLFPDEGIWLWANEMPPLSALRNLSLGAILGLCVERDINWYLQPEHVKVLLVRLTPQLDSIAQIVLHFAFSALVVIQDMLRVFILRIGCQRMEYAVSLLRPIISWMDNHIDETSNETSLPEMEIFKIHQLLLFIAGLLEHPCAKALLIEMGAVRILKNVLMACSSTSKSDRSLISESNGSSKRLNLRSLLLPALKSLALIFSSKSFSASAQSKEMCSNDNINFEECFFILHHLFKLFKVLAIGMELLACFVTFKELISWSQSKNALAYLVSRIQPSAKDDVNENSNDVYSSSKYDSRCSSPFLSCLEKSLKLLDATDQNLVTVVELICTLSLCARSLSMGKDKANGVIILKYLFGLPNFVDDATATSNEKLNIVKGIVKKLEQRIEQDDNLLFLIGKIKFYQVKESLKLLINLLSDPSCLSPKSEGNFTEDPHCPTDVIPSVQSEREQSSTRDHELSFPNIWSLNQGDEQADNHFSHGRFSEKFMWECSDSSLDRQLSPAKRKLSLTEGSGRRLRENTGSEAIGLSGFSRGLSTNNISSGPTRRDTFRQRKPNTSRPPSMHVDDYVARERNLDGASSGTNIASSSHRGGSGRPPSIHVDEFMARQRERHNPTFVIVGDTSQAKISTHVNVNDSIKLDKPNQLKTNLDDDLQEIDIVFDEESDSDDRMPFPQPDENLNPPAVIGESSSTSLVEETGESNENTNFTTLNEPPLAKGELSYSHRSDMQSEFPLPQQMNEFSSKANRGIGLRKSSFHEQLEESNYMSPSRSSAHSLQSPRNVTGFPSTHGASGAPSSVHSVGSMRFHHSNSSQKVADNILPSTAYGDKKPMTNQPPLPPTPPPAILSASTDEPVQIHSSSYLSSVRDIKPPVPSGYPPHAFDVGGNNSPAGFTGQSENTLSVANNSSSNSQPRLDSRFTINMASTSRPSLETSSRSMPPLPPMPPPFSTPMSHSPNSVQVSSSNQMNNMGTQPPMPNNPLVDSGLGIFSPSGSNLTYALPPYASSLLVSRPASTSATFFGSPALQNAQNFSSFSMPTSVSQPAHQPMQPRPPAPPLPQLPRPSHHPGHSIQLPHSQSEQLMPFQQGSIPVKVNPLQIPQQFQIPQLQIFYQTPQQEALSNPVRPIEQTQPEDHAQANSMSQQQKDTGMTLQQYFSSPEAIQSLLSDRDKLCHLLEQHPKLMQMLQERLGQQ